MSNLNETVSGLLQFIQGKTQEQIELLLINLRKAAAIEEEQNLCRIFSFDEYHQHLEKILTDENLKMFLEKCQCKNLFMLLYPDHTHVKWFDTVDDDVEDDEGKDDDGASTEEQWYIIDLVQILKTINTPDKTRANRVRLNFNTFLDVCWQAVGFDLWGKGNVDKVVFDHESKKKIKPNNVRKIFTSYIQRFFTKRIADDANEDVKNYIISAFKGN